MFGPHPCGSGQRLFQAVRLVSVGRAEGERQTNLSISHFECTADPVLDRLANLPLDESGRKRPHGLVQQVVPGVANAKPERVDLGNNTLEPDDAVQHALGFLVLGDAGNLNYKWGVNRSDMNICRSKVITHA